MTTHHNTDRTALESLTPAKAQDMWMQSKRGGDTSDRYFKSESFRVGKFVDWLVAMGTDDMNNVSARTVHEYRLAIKDDLKHNTVSQRVASARRFLSFCVTLDAVDPTVPELIEIPSRSGEPRTEVFETEKAETALDYYRKFDYASDHHTLLATGWQTGFRTGTLRSLDVPDLEDGRERVRVRHRPDTDTPLKNKERAERYVALSPALVDLLSDYVERQRPDVTDDHGREPLFATRYGRPHVNTLRRWFEGATRPCVYADECPHDKDPEECQAAQSVRHAGKCPSTVSGHPVRRGAITQLLRDDVPPRIVSDRMNVSEKVLEKNYDVRSEDEKAEQRREYVRDTW